MYSWDSYLGPPMRKSVYLKTQGFEKNLINFLEDDKPKIGFFLVHSLKGNLYESALITTSCPVARSKSRIHGMPKITD